MHVLNALHCRHKLWSILKEPVGEGRPIFLPGGPRVQGQDGKVGNRWRTLRSKNDKQARASYAWRATTRTPSGDGGSWFPENLEGAPILTSCCSTLGWGFDIGLASHDWRNESQRLQIEKVKNTTLPDDGEGWGTLQTTFPNSKLGWCNLRPCSSWNTEVHFPSV